MNFLDSLKNLVSGLGTARDKASATTYTFSPLLPDQLQAAYRGAWLPRAIVDIPAQDATRKWRSWQAEKEQIEALEKLEARLHVRTRIEDALRMARLYGGAALYIATNDRNSALELRPDRVREIRSLTMLSCFELTPDPVNRDIDSPWYGLPEAYRLNRRQNGGEIVIHASRLIVFHGSDTMGDDYTSFSGWGDSVLQSSYDAIRQFDAIGANIGSLVFEAKVNVYKFKGFADLLARQGGTDVALSRMVHQTTMKGINGDVVIDAEDDFQPKSASFSGLDALWDRAGNVAAGAAGIPVTRLFRSTSVGLSGTGDGDERVYFDRIGHLQGTVIGPAMALFDDCMMQVALGTRPPEIFYRWNPLRQVTEKERADIFKTTADAARALAGAQAGELIPIDALSDSLVNELVEQGVLPGLDQKIEEFGSLSEQNDLPGDVPEMGTGDPDVTDID